MILENAKADAADYNRIGLHYNLVATGIYEARRRLDPLSEEYLPYIVAGLIAFDMGRMMGPGGAPRYDPGENGFGAWLHTNIRDAKKSLAGLVGVSLHEVELSQYTAAIQQAYDSFALRGQVSESGKEFHVGATKVLHWIVPDLFIMLDQNVARAFRKYHTIPYKNSTQPGYSAEKYLQCLKCAQSEITRYGIEKFWAVESETPVARLFDKVAFVVGARLSGA